MQRNHEQDGAQNNEANLALQDAYPDVELLDESELVEKLEPVSQDEFLQGVFNWGDKELKNVRRFIAENCDNNIAADIINNMDVGGNHVLTDICGNNKYNDAIFKAILSIRGLNLAVVNKNGDTSLIVAAYAGYYQKVKALLTKITDIKDLKHVNHDRRTAAQVAEYKGHYGIAARILAKMSKLEKSIAPIPHTATFQQRIAQLQSEKFQVNIPRDFQCPISHTIMNDPISVSNGMTYDRESLVRLFSIQGNPEKINVSSESVDISELDNQTCVTIKNQIENFVHQQEQEKKLLKIPLSTLAEHKISDSVSSQKQKEFERNARVAMYERQKSKSVSSVDQEIEKNDKESVKTNDISLSRR